MSGLSMNHLAYAAVAFGLWIVSHCIYNVFLHPLRAVPGPTLAKISRWWLFCIEMKGNPHVEILKLHRKYGPMLRISPNEVSFNDVEAFRILYGRTSKFMKAEYYYRAFEDQSSNLFTMRDRQQHSSDKRLLSHAFSRANVAQHYTSIYDKAEYLMGRVKRRAEKDETIPLFPAFRCMTLDTISDFAFGEAIGALQIENFDSAIFHAIDRSVGSVSFFQHFPVLREALRWATRYNISAVPNGFLDLARAADVGLRQIGEDQRWTMFGNMISAATKASIDITKDHLIEEGIVMFVAGTDTTAASLTVTFHHLLQQPEVYRKLQEEIRTIMPTLDSKPSVEELDTLPFLNACVREGLRISSPSRFRMPRTVPDGGWAFKGQYFPPKTIVSMSPLYLLHDEMVFPDPERYDPSRWLVHGEEKTRRMSYFYPFSSGTRQCIGQSLSLIEQKIVLSLLMRRFNCKEVLKQKVDTREAVTIVIDDPADVRLNIVTG